MEALEQLKMLLGIEDDEQGGLLSFLIGDCENLILGYCRIREIPERLKSLVPVMAADMYRRKGFGSTEAQKQVKSISQGDQSLTFESGVLDTDAFLSEYEARLKPFRCRRGRVPSDLDV